jgi:hypothetical protein
MSEGTWRDGKPVPYAPVDKVETKPVLVDAQGQAVKAPMITAAEFKAKAGEVLAVTGHWPIDTAIVVFGNILGQLIARKANNVPGKIEGIVQRVALGLKAGALQKMVYDDEQRRKG